MKNHTFSALVIATDDGKGLNVSSLDHTPPLTQCPESCWVPRWPCVCHLNTYLPETVQEALCYLTHFIYENTGLKR